MFHLSQPIPGDEKFKCDDETCRCKLPGTPKKIKSNKEDAVKMEWEEIDPSIVEAPINFGQVENRVYRSSFPRPRNYKFLDTLNLKTIICLVDDKPLPAQYVEWTQTRGIALIQIGMPGHREAFRDGIPYEQVGEALRLVVNQGNYPLLIHCNRGKHRTGTVVACLRKLKGWHSTRALDEYSRFSHPKERPTDQDFIGAFDIDSLRRHVNHARVSNTSVSMVTGPSSPSSPTGMGYSSAGTNTANSSSATSGTARERGVFGALLAEASNGQPQSPFSSMLNLARA